MAVSLTVRSTIVDDHPGLPEVVRAAFSDDTRDGNVEVDIVLDTRALGQPVRPIDLVAGDGDTILGHVLGARGTFGDGEAIAVAPLAVAPSHQGRGMGTRLMPEIPRPRRRGAEIAARTLAVPDAQSVEDLPALVTSVGER